MLQKLMWKNNNWKLVEIWKKYRLIKTIKSKKIRERINEQELIEIVSHKIKKRSDVTFMIENVCCACLCRYTGKFNYITKST